MLHFMPKNFALLDFVPSRAKHPAKVHVWAGISQRGPTEICIFEGEMNAPLFTSILDGTLLPFLRREFASGHKFMQDNDPKHTSVYARHFMEDKGINWWRTAPESPDLNPIENLWHELKEFIRRVVKPQTKEELMELSSSGRRWMLPNARNTLDI